MTDDPQLVARLREGDRGALRDIYERHKDGLLTVARCLVFDAATAEDVLHDAFVAFSGRAAQVRLRGSLRSYLAACVANRARDELRRRSRGPSSSDAIAHEPQLVLGLHVPGRWFSLVRSMRGRWHRA